jgi:hypothetical protein
MRTGATFSAASAGAARQQANAATINFTQRFISNLPVRKSLYTDPREAGGEAHANLPDRSRTPRTDAVLRTCHRNTNLGAFPSAQRRVYRTPVTPPKGKRAIGIIHGFLWTAIRLHVASEVRPAAISTGTQVIDEIHRVTSVARPGSALVDVSASRAYCNSYG